MSSSSTRSATAAGTRRPATRPASGLGRLSGADAGPRRRDPRRWRCAGARWRRWYDFFPWEDWREGRPAILDEALLPALQRWARGAAPATSRCAAASAGASASRLAFGDDGARWDEERVLDRYELLYEAGLVAEASRDGRVPLDDSRAADRRPGAPCASTTAGSWRPRSRGCGRS